MVFILESLALQTRARRQIPNYLRVEQPPFRLRAAVETVRRDHPTARLRSATGTYNCYGLVFANRRTWVDGDNERNIQMILEDDGYRRLQSNETPEPGDVILYRRRSTGELSHAAVVMRIVPSVDLEVHVISQWGAHGEYFHRADDVAAILGEPREYWTDRRPLP